MFLKTKNLKINMPPDFGKIRYGATAWAFKNPIAKKDIIPTFKLARATFDKAGFSGRRCSIALFAQFADGVADIGYAKVVGEASEEYDLIPITTILRPKPSPSLVSEAKEERSKAISQCKQGIIFAYEATPIGIPIVVDGPFHLVHGLGEEESLNTKRRKHLKNGLIEIAKELEEVHAYGAIEPLRPSETQMSPGIQYWLKLLDDVGSDNLGILVDTVHFYELQKQRSKADRIEGMFSDIEQVRKAGRAYGFHLSNSPSRVEWEEAGDIAKHTPRLLNMLKQRRCNVTVAYEGFVSSLDKLVGLQRRKDQQDQLVVNKRSMEYLAGHVNAMDP